MHRAWLVLFLVIVCGCFRNPVTGRKQLSLVSQKEEIQLGQEGQAQVAQSLGLYPDPKVQQYVSTLGMRLALASERPQLPYSFQVLDEAGVNAFALPGGPVFVTRGLLTHLNSEAELVTVLGHEVGHIAARDSIELLSKAQLAQLGLGLGSIFVPEIGQLAGVGASLLFLRFGRDAERRADDLGFKYAVAQGYDARAMADLFTTLDLASRSERGRVPQWLSTHPNPENRIEKLEERLQKTSGVDWNQLKRGRDELLDVINGMTFGENPRNGYFAGETFLHPSLELQVDFPSGWQHRNQPEAVVSRSPREDAVVALAGAGEISPEEAARKFFAAPGMRAGQAVAGVISGLPAVVSSFEAETEQGLLGGLVAFVSHRSRTYELVGFTGAGQVSAYEPVFRAFLGSFRPLSDPRALAAQPMRLSLVTAPREMSAAEFQQQFPSSIPLEQVEIINGLTGGKRIAAGQRVKRVTGGVEPPAVSGIGRPP